MSNFSLTGTQNTPKIPYGKSFGWTPYTLGGGQLIKLSDHPKMVKISSLSLVITQNLNSADRRFANLRYLRG
mgnify:CR=1 FL=1